MNLIAEFGSFIAVYGTLFAIQRYYLRNHRSLLRSTCIWARPYSLIAEFVTVIAIYGTLFAVLTGFFAESPLLIAKHQFSRLAPLFLLRNSGGLLRFMGLYLRFQRGYLRNNCFLLRSTSFRALSKLLIAEFEPVIAVYGTLFAKLTGLFAEASLLIAKHQFPRLAPVLLLWSSSPLLRFMGLYLRS